MPVAVVGWKLIGKKLPINQINSPALTVLDEAQPLLDVIAAGHRGAHNHIRMAVHVFGQRIDDQIGAQLQRPLQVRRQECVVHDDDDLRGKDINIVISARSFELLNTTPFKSPAPLSNKQKTTRVLFSHRVNRTSEKWYSHSGADVQSWRWPRYR